MLHVVTYLMRRAEKCVLRATVENRPPGKMPVFAGVINLSLDLGPDGRFSWAVMDNEDAATWAKRAQTKYLDLEEDRDTCQVENTAAWLAVRELAPDLWEDCDRLDQVVARLIAERARPAAAVPAEPAPALVMESGVE